LSGFDARLLGCSKFSQEILLALPLLHINPLSLVQAGWLRREGVK
jgi:hypothetical protein